MGIQRDDFQNKQIIGLNDDADDDNEYAVQDEPHNEPEPQTQSQQQLLIEKFNKVIRQQQVYKRDVSWEIKQLPFEKKIRLFKEKYGVDFGYFEEYNETSFFGLDRIFSSTVYLALDFLENFDTYPNKDSYKPISVYMEVNNKIELVGYYIKIEKKLLSFGQRPPVPFSNLSKLLI